MLNLYIESDDNKDFMFIQTVPYYDLINNLVEDIVNKDDILQHYTKYTDTVDTRKNIAKYLQPVSRRIKDENDFVISSYVDTSPDRIKKGLSNYIEVEFKHPEDVEEEYIDTYYKYAIRFSDHLPKRTKKYKTSQVPIVGMKPKNLEKAAIKHFKSSLADIESRIREFELKKYGKQITFFNR